MNCPAAFPSPRSSDAETGWVRLSLLEHYAYCAHQALLLIDGVWNDNHLTVAGSIGHERVDEVGSGWQRGVKVHRRVELASASLRVHGLADVIEEHPDGELIPVEYKHGRGAGDLWPATVQVVAQAMCLESMLDRAIPTASIYVAKEKARVEVKVRQHESQVIDLIESLRKDMVAPPPPAIYSPTLCRSCSVRDSCQPLWNGGQSDDAST